MDRLYAFSHQNDEKRAPLYIKGFHDGAAIKRGQKLDFSTYFNVFSLQKWKEYTTLDQLAVRLNTKGNFRIKFSLYGEHGVQILHEEDFTGPYEHGFYTKDIDGILLGFEMAALEDGCEYHGGAYYGQFVESRDVSIGVGICTYKRETYVRKTMSALKDLQEAGASWLHVLVVDNGNSLAKVAEGRMRVLANRNFGGSGGFTRAMLEYNDDDSVDYVLLMDDDIDLEPTVLERSHALLCGLRKEYQDSFLAGAMLSLDCPVMQRENIAWWQSFRRQAWGKDVDVSEVASLVSNEQAAGHENQYGGWWFCCIPVKRIREIGYPLPMFIKGDDMEYGIRNHRPILAMNGIGVWHEDFVGKFSPVINYYSDRGMLILNSYADGCGWGTFAVSAIGRLARSLLQGKLLALKMYAQALKDYDKGFYELTRIGADEKMARLIEQSKSPTSCLVILQVLWQTLSTILGYPASHAKYKEFMSDKLMDDRFWKEYLGLLK